MGVHNSRNNNPKVNNSKIKDIQTVVNNNFKEIKKVDINKIFKDSPNNFNKEVKVMIHNSNNIIIKIIGTIIIKEIIIIIIRIVKEKEKIKVVMKKEEKETKRMLKIGLLHV